MAEYYSLNLAEEVKKGITEKAQRGEYQSAAPFGYVMENKKLVIVPEEADLVRFLFEKFVSKEMGMRTLAAYFNNLGIKSKRAFENRTIDYILNNPVYISKVRWTPTGKIRRNYNQPDFIIVDSNHEPIVSEELWAKAQAVIKENKELFPYRFQRNSTKSTWLHGLVHCGSCDKKLVRSLKVYMQCNGYSKGQCKTSNFIKYTILEDLTLEALKSPIELSIGHKPNNSQNSVVYELINRQLDLSREKFERIRVAYQDGIDTLDEYKNNKVSIKSEREKLYSRLAELIETHLAANDKQTVEKRLKDIHELLTVELLNLRLNIK